MNDVQKHLRKLPSVDSVLKRKDVTALIEKEGRKLVADAVRSLILKKRTRIIKNKKKGVDAETRITSKEITGELMEQKTPSIVRVINATGVVIHTNLGRAPLPAPSLDYLKELAGGFCNLEYRLEEGGRGSRYDHIQDLLREMTGAQAAHVVNNNAAALMLAASCIAKGKEIIISRGELIEIGDSFRLPDVIAHSGAELVEVGTTNRTKPADYERAVNERTGMIIKAHQSNFYMDGFVEETPIEKIVELGRRHSIPVLYDIGSGALDIPESIGSSHEPGIKKSVESGADLVTFSGDKLLGGPQAGLIVGKKEIVTHLRHHPMTRALRPCKLTITLLHHVLLLYRQQRYDEIPVYEMIARESGELEKEARSLGRIIRKALHGSDWSVEVEREKSKVGGGALPREVMESWVVRVKPGKLSPEKIEEKLRNGRIPIICRLKNDRVVFDVRTLGRGDNNVIAETLVAIKA